MTVWPPYIPQFARRLKALFVVGVVVGIGIGPASAQPLAAPAHPQRIVSLSLCMDELVLALVEPQRIAGLSRLASDPNYSLYSEQAQKLPAHSGLAEQIIALQPDLIIGAQFELGKAGALLRQLGYPVLSFATPTQISAIETLVEQVGAALSAQNNAQKIIAKMRAELQQADALVVNTKPMLALSYAPNGYSPGTLSIKNEILHRAGLRTIADELDMKMDGNLSLEQVLRAEPELIILEESTGNTQSLAHQFLTHPALIAWTSHEQNHPRKILKLPTALWLCPGPAMTKAVLTLAQQKRTNNDRL